MDATFGASMGQGIDDYIGNGSNYTAVSYTHLDVYKRQGIRSLYRITSGTGPGWTLGG